MYGAFDVERFVRNGAVTAPLATDGTVWRRVANAGRYDNGSVLVQFANGETRFYSLIDDLARAEWTLGDQSQPAAVLHYVVQPRGVVVLDGRIKHNVVELRLRAIDPKTFDIF